MEKTTTPTTCQNNLNNNTQDCPVCLQNMNNKIQICLPCSPNHLHVLCLHCFIHLPHKLCPLCRKSFLPLIPPIKTSTKISLINFLNEYEEDTLQTLQHNATQVKHKVT